MALPSMVLDTYRRYKKGTESFVQWLAGTARTTGSAEEVFQSVPKEQIIEPRGRLKGRKRKEAKRAGRSAKRSKYTIPVMSFIQLAKAIVATKEIAVPSSVLTTLSAVIQGRKDCAAWYMLNQDDADETMRANNDSHRHFIKILEETFELLSVRHSLTEPILQSDSDEYSSCAMNMFEYLDPDTAGKTQTIPDVVDTSDADTDSEYALETSDADVSFALYCFMKDLTRIRIFVRRTWRQFKSGEIGLQTASLTMNTAIGIIKSLSQDFEETFPRFKGNDARHMHENVILFLFTGHCTKKEGPQFLADEDEDEDTHEDPFAYKENGQMLQTATVMCMHTTDLLQKQFFDSPKRKLRLTNDEKKFVGCLILLAGLAKSSPEELKYFHGDMVHEAVRHMVEKSRLDTWNIFAMQIFWDTHREFASLLPLGQQLLENACRHFMSGWHTYIDQGHDKAANTDKRSREDTKLRVKNMEAEVLGSSSGPASNTHFTKTIPQIGTIMGKPILRYHPSLCGLTLLNIRDRYHSEFMGVASDSGSILSCLHLYNAALRSGLLSELNHWADLNFLVEQGGIDNISKGSEAKDGNRTVKVSHDLVSDDIGDCRLVPFSRYQKLTSESMKILSDELYGSSGAYNDLASSARALARDPSILGHTMSTTVLQTLDVSKDAMEADDVPVHFDVMELQLRCSRLLRKIQLHCMQHAKIDFPKQVYNKQSGMNATIAEILTHHSGKPHQNRLMFPDAVDMLRKFIKEEGTAVLEKASTQQADIRLPRNHGKKKAEPSFENPFDNLMSLDWRDRFGMIVLQDANGDCHMPFGIGQ
jgi:hypothetical protein